MISSKMDEARDAVSKATVRHLRGHGACSWPPSPLKLVYQECDLCAAKVVCQGMPGVGPRVCCEDLEGYAQPGAS